MTDIDGDVLDLDGLIERLVATAAIGPQPEPGTSPEAKNTGSPRAPRPRIFEWELSALCATVTELLRSEPVQPNVPAPVQWLRHHFSSSLSAPLLAARFRQCYHSQDPHYALC